MTMTVIGAMSSTGDQFYYSKQWRQIVETHLSWIRLTQEVQQVVISTQLGYKYEGDLYGALTELGIPIQLHYVTMRLNGFVSPVDYDGTAGVVMVPTENSLNRLINMAQTVQKKITA